MPDTKNLKERFSYKPMSSCTGFECADGNLTNFDAYFKTFCIALACRMIKEYLDG